MLTARNLAIYVFIIVSMQSGHTARVANPEVDRVGLLFKRDSCPSNVSFHIVVEWRVLVSEVVVFWCKSE